CRSWAVSNVREAQYGGQGGIPIASRSGGRRCVFLGSRRLRDPKAWVLTHPVRHARSRMFVKLKMADRVGFRSLRDRAVDAVSFSGRAACATLRRGFSPTLSAMRGLECS